MTNSRVAVVTVGLGREAQWGLHLGLDAADLDHCTDGQTFDLLGQEFDGPVLQPDQLAVLELALDPDGLGRELLRGQAVELALCLAHGAQADESAVDLSGDVPELLGGGERGRRLRNRHGFLWVETLTCIRIWARGAIHDVCMAQ